MRHENHGVRVAGQVFLEPVPRVEVEMVGRLVEQQQSGAAEQQLRQGDAHLPAARERLARPVEVLGGESQPAQNGGDLQIDAEALQPAEGLLQLAVPGEHRGVIRLVGGIVGHLLFERLDLRPHVEERLEGQASFFDERPAAVVQTVLRQIPDGEAGGLDDQCRSRAPRGRRAS